MTMNCCATGSETDDDKSSEMLANEISAERLQKLSWPQPACFAKDGAADAKTGIIGTRNDRNL
jgi:hypothetical protein